MPAGHTWHGDDAAADSPCPPWSLHLEEGELVLRLGPGEFWASSLQLSSRKGGIHKDILCPRSHELLQKPVPVLPVGVAIWEDPVPVLFPVLCQDLLLRLS